VAVPAPHPWRTEGEGLDEVARRALLAFVSAPQVLLDSGVLGCIFLPRPGGKASGVADAHPPWPLVSVGCSAGTTRPGRVFFAGREDATWWVGGSDMLEAKKGPGSDFFPMYIF
jgi:hypothetical protein